MEQKTRFDASMVFNMTHLTVFARNILLGVFCGFLTILSGIFESFWRIFGMMTITIAMIVIIVRLRWIHAGYSC
jgi:hypothetical protein